MQIEAQARETTVAAFDQGQQRLSREDPRLGLELRRPEQLASQVRAGVPELVGQAIDEARDQRGVLHDGASCVCKQSSREQQHRGLRLGARRVRRRKRRVGGLPSPLTRRRVGQHAELGEGPLDAIEVAHWCVSCRGLTSHRCGAA